jgi:hypothetical protein
LDTSSSDAQSGRRYAAQNTSQTCKEQIIFRILKLFLSFG